MFINLLGTKRFSFFLTLFFIISANALAHNKVVVIPMAGEDLKPLQNVITVAEANGDFTSLSSALSSITDASSRNPYLVVVAPGVYSNSSPMLIPPYVHVTGSGRYSTRLTGTTGGFVLDETSAYIQLSDNSEISNLTIATSNTNTFSISIYGLNRGFSGEPAKISDVYIDPSSQATHNIGIYDDEGDLIISDSKLYIQRTGATGLFLYGIYTYRTNTRIHNCDITARSTADGTMYGIYQSDASFSDIVKIRNTEIFTGYTGGGMATGIENLDTSYHIEISNSTIDAKDTSINGDVILSSSKIEDGDIGTLGTQKCFNVINSGDENSAALLGTDCT